MDDEAASPLHELLKPVRALYLLGYVELHARTFVHHDVNLSQPQHDARHVVTWSGFSQMLF